MLIVSAQCTSATVKKVEGGSQGERDLGLPLVAIPTDMTQSAGCNCCPAFWGTLIIVDASRSGSRVAYGKSSRYWRSRVCRRNHGLS